MNKKDFDTIINDIIWSYEECGMKVPQNILDTINTLKQFQGILNEYNVSAENIRRVLLTGQMFINQPTLDDCIKEWNNNGFTVTVSDMTITISNCDTVDDIREEMEIEIHLVLKTIYYMDDVELTFDLQNLLSKTIKAAEVEKNDKN